MSSSDELTVPHNNIINNDYKILNRKIIENYEKQITDLKNTIKAQKCIYSSQTKRQQKSQHLKKENNILTTLNKYYSQELLQQLIENLRLQLKIKFLTHQINLRNETIKYIEGKKNPKLQKDYKLLHDEFKFISEENENLQFYKVQFKSMQKKSKELQLMKNEKMSGKKRKLSQII